MVSSSVGTRFSGAYGVFWDICMRRGKQNVQTTVSSKAENHPGYFYDSTGGDRVVCGGGSGIGCGLYGRGYAVSVYHRCLAYGAVSVFPGNGGGTLCSGG